MALVFDISPPIDQGDSFTMQVTCYRRDLVTLIDLTNAQGAFFTVRHTSNPSDPLLLQKLLNAGITISNPTTGVLLIAATPSDILQLPADTHYYDVVIIESNGTRSTVLKGQFPIAAHPRPQ